MGVESSQRRIMILLLLFSFSSFNGPRLPHAYLESNTNGRVTFPPIHEIIATLLWFNNRVTENSSKKKKKWRNFIGNLHDI